MKKLVALVIAVVMIAALVGCAKKYKPAINIKHDSVTSLTFKRTVFSETDINAREYIQKEVTAKDDVEVILDWIESLRLAKHEAIEVPAEMVEYLIVFGDAKEHTLIFFDDYAVYDGTAYTFEDSAQQDDVTEKYNLLNYEEKETELDLY